MWLSDHVWRLESLMICKNNSHRRAVELNGRALREWFIHVSWLLTHHSVSDQVMGGVSMAHLTREIFDGRISNVLRGMVRMENNGGFIQMATNLKRDGTTVDVSKYDGLELLVQNGTRGVESFNVQYVLFQCFVPVIQRYSMTCNSQNPEAASKPPTASAPFHHTGKRSRPVLVFGKRYVCHFRNLEEKAQALSLHRLICHV